MAKIDSIYYAIAPLLLAIVSAVGSAGEADPKPVAVRKSVVLEVTYQSRSNTAVPATLRDCLFMREIELQDATGEPQNVNSNAGHKVDLFNLKRVEGNVAVLISDPNASDAVLFDEHGKLLRSYRPPTEFLLATNETVSISTSGTNNPAAYTLRITDMDHAPSVKPEPPELTAKLRRWAAVALDGAGSVQAIGRPDKSALKTIRVVEGSAAIPDVVQIAASKRWPFIGPNELADLAGLKNLRHLDLSGTHINDASLVYLKNLDRLDSLNLSGTRINGTGLIHLANLHRLTSLDISGTYVGDSTVAALKKFGHLRSINAARSKLTSEAMWDLRWAVPGGMDDLDGKQVKAWGQYWGTLTHKTGTTTPQSLAASSTERDRDLLQILIRGCSLRLAESGDPVVAIMPRNDVRENLTFHPVEQNVHTLALLANFGTIEKVVFERQYPAIDECMVAELSGLHQLTCIDVHECWLTEPAWKRMSQFSRLTTINYDQALITDAMVETLHAALPHCTFLGTPKVVFHDDIRIHR